MLVRKQSDIIITETNISHLCFSILFAYILSIGLKKGSNKKFYKAKVTLKKDILNQTAKILRIFIWCLQYAITLTLQW